MARFTEELQVLNRLAGRVHRWELCEPMTYVLSDAPGAEVVTVPPGFSTDFASVPRPFWFWIAPWGRHGRAAIIHDFLYQEGSITDLAAGTLRRPSKREADRIFREAMAVLDRVIIGRSRFWRRMPQPLVWVRLAFAGARRWLMWAAVAAFGHFAYRRQQRQATAPALEHEMLAGLTDPLDHAEREPTVDASAVPTAGSAAPG